MFSSEHDRTWQQVRSNRQIPYEAAAELLAHPQPQKDCMADLFFAADLGTGGKLDETILQTARGLKKGLFDNQVYGIVPVYVTSMCSEHCVYCNYRAENKDTQVERIRLSDEELAKEAQYLIDEKGLRTLELVYATDPQVRVDAMCRHVELVKGILERHGGGTVGINAEALDEDEYTRLVNAGLAFAVLWQETYDRERYHDLHPGRTKKVNFDYRLDAYERMLAAGVQEVGIGILSGLADWRRDWAMLIRHETYLQRTYGKGTSIFGIPRLKQAAGAALQTTPFIPNRQEFLIAVAIHNIFSPESMAFVNTREDWELCVDLAQGGGCLFTFNCSTIPGGYSLGHRGYQFPTGSFDAPVFAEKLRQVGIKPSFEWPFERLEAERQSPAGAFAHV